MPSSRAGVTTEGVRRQNLGTLARILHEDGPSTRSYLSTATGLNRSTVGALTSELVGLDMVRERKGASTGVGRPSILVEPRSERVFTLAVDMRVGALVIALVGFGGEMLLRRERAIPSQVGRPHSRLVDQLARMARSALSESPADAVCVGVGVGVPGLVRHEDDVVREAPNLGWTDVPLGAMLRARLGEELPIWVGNDGDLGAIAEHRRGAARGLSHAIYLAADAGIGAGVITENRMLTGAGGYGGEVGHIQVNPRGRRCSCGARGCWETEAGAQALLGAMGTDDVAQTVRDVLERAADGDRVARRALRNVARWLGVGVASLVNVFNPEAVVFGGVLQDLLPAAGADLERALASALVAPRQQVRLVSPGLGRDSTLFGAAELAFEPMLRDPLGVLDPRLAKRPTAVAHVTRT